MGKSASSNFCRSESTALFLLTMGKKDPNAPKRPATGFFRYCSTVRAQVTAETGLKGPKAAKVLATKWKALSEEQRQKFNDDFKTEKAEYDVKLAAYKKTQNYLDWQAQSATNEKKKFRKAPKDKNAPKRPLSSYLLYSNEVRPALIAEMGTKNIGALGKKIGQMWKTVSEEDKQKYKDQSTKLKEQYKVTMAEYQKSPEYAAYQEIKRAWLEKKKKANKKTKTAKKKARRASIASSSSSGTDSDSSSSS